MQRYNQMSMPMPQPGAGSYSTSYGPTSTSYGAPTSNYGYGGSSYLPQVPTPSSDTVMDRDMRTLIENLKVSIKDASAEDLDILLKNEDKLNALIEETPQVYA